MTAHRDKLTTLQSMPMRADTVDGTFISAGWLLAEMDKAGGKRAFSYIGDRAVTVGVDAMAFRKPVHVGDLVRIETEIMRQGKSSLTIKVESHAERRDGSTEKVTEGLFTFVATDANHQPVEIKVGAPWLRPGFTAVSRAAHPARSGPPDASTLSLRDIPEEKDTNYLGDIFGGWILAKMDKACMARAERHTGLEAATVGLEAMTFHKPVFVGDEVSFYTEVVKTGRTSVTIGVETWAARHGGGAVEKVTEGLFSYVALDQNRQPTLIAQLP